uniref:Poly [ADP-ribose] polymerase 12-like n=1 Tax=Callorhinchus milii TaxID=7868 RepID=A0A4W3HSR5_CALMI|eukprot:gi/632947343/ref/XP_007889001.1/ PREDICTED: poly [ADP-ribose] polymerase 12-like [Callorhinchus milii]
MSQVTDLTEVSIKTLCSNEGALDYGTLHSLLSTDFKVSETELSRVLGNTEAFVVLNRAKSVGSNLAQGNLIIALTSVRLCRTYSKTSCNNCGFLHLCRRFVYDDCKPTDPKKRCTQSHDIHSPHNSAILTANGLGSLNTEELRQLLLQNDPILLPEVCSFYNKGSGRDGACSFKQSCKNIHICLPFILGTCSLGNQCMRLHSFLESRALFESCRLNIELVCDLPSIYLNICQIKIWKSASVKEKRSPRRKTSSDCKSDVDSENICLFFLRKHCSYKDQCKLVHFKLPYRWQIYEGTWKDFTNMEEIEKDFCDPSNKARGGSPPINFITMTSNSCKVRRLSTVSSVTKPEHYILTTEWLWYWQGDSIKWIEFGKQEELYGVASVTSADLENLYLTQSIETVEFRAGKYNYKLDFKGMLQINLLLGTCRGVRRRPRFISEQQMTREMYSKEQPGQGKDYPPVGKTAPTHWDLKNQPDIGYKLVQLQVPSEDYKQVESLFQKTMSNSTIRKIERVQNLPLWQVYQWQKEQMKKKSGKEVAEQLLFHGSKSSLPTVVCQQNFDWRICGMHGNGFGKGNYFATNASYADGNSPSPLSSRTMYLVKVLVGEFTKGKEADCRPPSKDNTLTNLYDSCTDNVADPSLFVIFDKHQIYPEYVIEYVKKVGFFQWIFEKMSGQSAATK